MISSLSIHNYALIRKLQIEPGRGLNIVTGETGAGKSIMLGAVGLLLGNRSDTKALLDKEKKCVIEGEFDISALGLSSFFEENDLDYEDHSIFRREINPKGKSRAFINDVPVTLEIIKSLGARLIDIHSQNESGQLAAKSTKLDLIDSYAGTAKELQVFESAYAKFHELSNELEELHLQEKNSKEDEDYKAFLLDELVKAALKENEQSELEEEQNLLENAEEIKQSLAQITLEFDSQDLSIIDRIKEAVSTLRKLSKFSENFDQLHDRFESVNVELIDIIQELQSEQDKIEHDPGRMEEVNGRLDLINRLQLKHKVQDITGLLEIQKNLEKESLGVLDLEIQNRCLLTNGSLI